MKFLTLLLPLVIQILVADAVTQKVTKKVTPNVNKEYHKKCSDGGYCPGLTTCCKNTDGQDNCCPYRNGVCCKNQIHCCPQSSTCDLINSVCKSNTGQVVAVLKTIDSVRLPQASVVCPDQKSSCPRHYTCCPGLHPGTFNCCPAPQAMCCEDHEHCCPHGSRCNPRRGECDRGNQVSVPWLLKVPSRTISLGQVMCPGGQFTCPVGTSCAKLKYGEYGCCPVPQGEGCSDGEHCCPKGYSCSENIGACTMDEFPTTFVRWLNVTDKAGQPPKPPATICPTGKYKCPSNQTCCARKGGLFGCCPFNGATCCSDGKHCCPKSYTCDLQKSKCIKVGSSAMLLSDLRTALDIRVPVTYQQLMTMSKIERNCPDKTSHCPDNNTCCINTKGVYGCCPVPEAICCSDKIHCCPKGYECDVGKGDCASLFSHHRRPFIGYKTACPKHYYFDYKNATCVKKNVDDELTHTVVSLADIKCADNKTSCPDRFTCCSLDDKKKYGCCPIPNAVCCADHKHCCPQGTRCNVEAGTCEQGEQRQEILLTEVQVGIVKCDDSTTCPDVSTCCQKTTGDFACCPHLDAVCCSDKKHCCPKGFKCNVNSTVACSNALYETDHSHISSDKYISLNSNLDKQNNIVPQEGPKDVRPAYKLDANDVVCPGGEFECPNGMTCCKIVSGQWGCCPYSKAVCCGDGVHCCPNGQTCDMQRLKCLKGGLFVSSIGFVKNYATRRPTI